MHHKFLLGASLCALTLATASTANAGIVTFALDPSSAPANLNFRWDAATNKASLTSVLNAPTANTVVLHGTTDSVDPVYDQEIDAINASTDTWIGYQLSVSGKVGGVPNAGIVFDSPATATAVSLDPITFDYGPTVFSTQSLTSSTEIDFTGGSLAPGGAVAFLFSVDVPVTNTDFEIDITQHPIVSSVPEPASASLLGLGVMGLLSLRRRRA